MEVTNTSNNATHSSHVENESFWKNHLKLQKTSGLTRSGYCRVHQLNYDRFGYWIYKWKQQACSLISVKLKKTNEIRASAPLCTLNFNNKFALQIHDQNTLGFILDKLSQ